MSTTIPALTSVTDILDNDLVMITHSNGESFKIAGSEINKRNQAVIASTTTMTGAPLKTGNIVRVYFTADITGSNTTTGLVINYNNVNYSVKVPKNGTLANFVASDLGGSPAVYKYLQANTMLELLYDGTQFIIIGNPLVLSGSGYEIYAAGRVKYNYCFIPQSSGADTYIKITLSRKDWGFGNNDYYGFIMTYYNGFEFYINARNGYVYPIGNYISTQNLSYITGVYVEIGDKVTIYIKTNGYRGFFIRFQGYLESMEESSTPPQGITFYPINFHPNS